MAQSTMRKVSLRNILAHKLRLALTLLAVVLGTAFISGSFMFTNSLSATFDSAVNNAFTGVDAAVRPQEGNPVISAETATAIEEDSEVRAVNVRGQQTIVVANEDSVAYQTGGGPSLLTPYYPPEKVVGEPATLVEGAAPKGPDQVIINEAAAKKHGIGLGDKILVVDAKARHNAEIVGIFSPAVKESSVGGAISLEMEAQAFLDRYASNGSVNVLAVAGTGTSPDALVEHLNKEYPVKAESGAKLAEEMSKTISDALKFVNYFLIAFGLIALLVGTFIIANTFSMIVAQRTKEFALLRALGASRGQITRSVVFESIIVGLIGSAVGVVAGMGLVAAIKAVMNSRGMAMDSSLDLSTSSIVVPLILGTVVTIISAWAPARRAGAVQPVEAMRSVETAAGSSLKLRTVSGLILMLAGIALALGGVAMDGSETKTRAIMVGIGAICLIVGFFLAGPALSLPVVPTLGKVIGLPFGAVGQLAATNSRRNPRRAAATAFALTLGVALVTAIGALGATMKASIADTVERNVAADYILAGPTQGGFPTPQETQDLARNTEGVEAVISLSMAPVTVDGKAAIPFGPYAQTRVIDADPSKMVTFQEVEGTTDIYGTPGFIAAKNFADANGWAVGQQYELAIPGVSDKTETITLVGTFKRNSLIKDMVVPKNLVENIAPESALRLQMVGVVGEPGYDKEELRRNLEDSVKDLVVVQVASGDEYAGQAASMIDQMLFILYALLALAVIIAVLGIVNTLTLGVIERRQEIGMLRAVGTHRRQVRTMITLEAVQIAVFGAVIGMLIGLLLGWSFLQVLAGEGLEQLTIPWNQILLMLVLSAVVGVIAAIWPSHRAAKTPPLEAIRS